jgi:SH3-like domain-containing protein
MIRFRLASVVLLVSGMWAAEAAEGAEAADAVKAPYFVSLKDETTNMREGPSRNNRIKWVYHRKGLPVEVVASYDVWRRVRDMDGEIGWIHMALLSRERSAVVTGQSQAPVYDSANAQSEVVAEAKPGAIGRLERCGPVFCEVKFDGAKGWLERTRLWGMHDGEQF